MEIRVDLHNRIKEALESFLLEDEIVYSQLSSVSMVLESYDSLLSTNKRLIHVKKRYSIVDLDEYPLLNISLELEYGIIYDTVIVFSGRMEMLRMTLFALDRTRTLNFIKDVEEHSIYRKGFSSDSDSKKEEECDFKQKLKDLAELKKKGIITEEEFEEKKSQILKDI